MLPNKFVVLWDNLPIGYIDYQKPFKTTDINKVHWFEDRTKAEDFVTFHTSYQMQHRNMLVKEIQFRIMGDN